MVIVVAGLLLALPSAGRAQEGRWRATAAVEYAHITEDDGFLGVGIGGGGGVEFALTDRTTLGLDVSAVRHIRDLEFYAVAFDAGGRPVPLPFTERWEGTARFGLVTIAHAFGTASLRPVVWGGAGMMSHGGTSSRPLTSPQVPPGYTLQEGDTFTRLGRSSTAFAFEGGGGVDIDVTPRVTQRPFAGLRLVNTENVGPKYIIRAGTRVAIGW
jgi:opacity protein-like surface antigen